MYKPYKVEQVNWIISKITFEGQTIKVYKWAEEMARQDAALLNGAYLAGVCAACSQMKDTAKSEEVLKSFSEE